MATNNNGKKIYPTVSIEEKRENVINFKATTTLDIHEAKKVLEQIIPDINFNNMYQSNIVLRNAPRSKNDEEVLIGKSIKPEKFKRYTFDKRLEEMFMEVALREKVFLFTGTTGSGKTIWADYIAHKLTNGVTTFDRIVKINLWGIHYEYFMYESSVTDNGVLEINKGAFLKLCDRASADPNNNYVLILDDINRCNIADVLCDCTKMIKQRNKSIKTRYGGTATMPENVVVLATMCEFDIGTYEVSSELRNLFPEYEITGDDVDISKLLNSDDEDVIMIADKIRKITLSINQFIRSKKRDSAYSIGPRSFDGNIETIFDLQDMVEGDILPHLQYALKEDYRNDAIASEISTLENFVRTGILEV